MKKYISIFLLSCLPFLSYCQNVGINSTGAAPDKSAMLDVTSTNKGMLVPRMTSAQRTIIASPAKGLLVFDTDVNSFWFFNGATWNDLSGGSGTSKWTTNGTNIFNNNTGNVGIGTNTPSEKLTVLSGYDTYGLTLTDGDIKISSYIGKGHGAWFGTQSNHPLHLYTNASGTPNVTFHQNFETDLRGPKSRLKFYDETSSLLISGDVRSNGSNLEIAASKTTGLVGQPGNLILQVDDASVVGLPLIGGKVGIGTNNPIDKLTVLTPTSQYGITHTDGNISVSTFVGGSTGGGWIGTRSNHSLSFFTNGSSPQVTINTNGNLGIGTSIPTNKLQIGSMGLDGFSGTDLAIGNGTNALGIFQTNTASQFASSTNIILMPRILGGSVGRVGINTASPRAPLDVVGQTVNQFEAYTFVNFKSGLYGWKDPCFNCAGQISIFASDRIVATEFDALSDSRIKDILGNSNSTQDLQTLNALQITDYTMKDKVQHGNKTYKKVIAQQVEKVYPQVVSKHTDFIPNVYQPVTKVEKTADGYTFNFTNKHNIRNNAKKIRVILPDGGIKEMNVVSIPSATQVVVNGIDIKGDKLFVYGEEVNDFRTVDYEGLTTLNISASQELSKLIKKQQKKLDILQQEIMLLGNQIRLLKQPQVKLSSVKQKSNSIKSKKLRS